MEQLKHHHRDIGVAAGLLCLLLISDIWLFRTVGWVRFLAGAVTFLGLLLLVLHSRLSVHDIGLTRSQLRPGLQLAAKLIAIYTVGLLVVFFLARSIFKDPRYNYPFGTALYSAMLILPLKTVLFEELVFRGIVPALVNKRTNVWTAIGVSSILFGLWHLTTALDVRGALSIHGFALPSVLILGGIFSFTSAAGVLLCWLRYKSDSLLAPIALHWFVNGSAVVLAAIAWA